MAKADKTAKDRRLAKPSMRQLAKTSKPGKKRSLNKQKSAAGRPLKKVWSFGQKEYHPVKLPEGRAGKILNKRVRIVPKFFSEAWSEIRQVTWPNRRETLRLTFAVFIFSIIFAVIVAGLDFVLDKIFRTIITS